MKNLTKYFFLAFLAFSTYMYSVPNVNAAECSSGSVQDFNTYATSKGYKVYSLTPLDVQKVSALMQIPADGMQFTILDKEKGTVGIVLFYKGCIVPGSMIVLSMESFLSILTNAKVDVEKIVELSDA